MPLDLQFALGLAAFVAACCLFRALIRRADARGEGPVLEGVEVTWKVR